MFPIKGIREHITNKLDEISVLRKFKNGNGILEIKETERENGNERILLNKIKVTKIPLENVWIFENEFDQQNISGLIGEQKGAFTSSGKKVEKTIIYYKSNRLYIFMIEMKRTISPKKMQTDVVKKFESSLSTLSVFISAHFDFPQFEDAKIYPVGICCYNNYDDLKPLENNDPKLVTGRVRQKYSNGERKMLLNIEPISLNRIKIPVLFCQNPNKEPITDNFTIEFDKNIMQPLSG